MKTLLSILAVVAITTVTIPSFAHSEIHSNALKNINIDKLTNVTSSKGLNSKVLKSALNAYAWAYEHGKLGSNKNILTVVDFSLSSSEKRMWVIDLSKDKILMNLYTTQGDSSSFSNKPGTKASCLGLFTTADIYYGRNGKSMRINGLEKGINDKALSRAIVVHGAWYAAPNFVSEYHRTGRSWGCFAVDPAKINKLYKNIQGGSALFAYAKSEEKDPIVKNGPIALG